VFWAYLLSEFEAGVTAVTSSNPHKTVALLLRRLGSTAIVNRIFSNTYYSNIGLHVD
jgi:hypothetical protein